jgi:hypothetical protein
MLFDTLFLSALRHPEYDSFDSLWWAYPPCSHHVPRGNLAMERRRLLPEYVRAAIYATSLARSLKRPVHGTGLRTRMEATRRLQCWHHGLPTVV